MEACPGRDSVLPSLLDCNHFFGIPCPSRKVSSASMISHSVLENLRAGDRTDNEPPGAATPQVRNIHPCSRWCSVNTDHVYIQNNTMHDDTAVPPPPTNRALTGPSSTDHSTRPLLPTSDPMDLMNRISGLYRLLDLISEDGSGGAGPSFLNVLFIYIPALTGYL